LSARGALLSALFATAAGAAPLAPLEVTPARTEAAGYAVTHALLVSNLLKNCAPFQDRLKDDLKDTLAAWKQRNGERVIAAEAYFAFTQEAIQRRDGATAAEAFREETHGVFVAQANKSLNDIFGPLGPQAAVCERWAAAIAKGDADLNWQSQYMPMLDEMVERARALKPGAR
jgi:hypothetical protein